MTAPVGSLVFSSIILGVHYFGYLSNSQSVYAYDSQSGDSSDKDSSDSRDKEKETGEDKAKDEKKIRTLKWKKEVNYK